MEVKDLVERYCEDLDIWEQEEDGSFAEGLICNYDQNVVLIEVDGKKFRVSFEEVV